MHHANLLIAPSIEQSSLPSQLRTTSADVRHIRYDQLGIEDVRTLSAQCSARSFSGGEYTFVLLVPAMTVEAQNALLKLFEEPPRGVVFYLVVPHESLLLPTLRSRLALMESEPTSSVGSAVADSFYHMSYKDRMEEIAQRIKAKDLAWQKELLAGIPLLQVSSPSYKRSLQLCEQYLSIRGANRKMLLEELALSLPPHGRY